MLEAMVCTVYIYGQITLSNIAGVARKINKECDATLQAFDEKFTKKAVLFFQAMFALALQENIGQTNVILPLIGAFTAVYILDSSTVSLPESLKKQFPGSGGDASTVAVKIYLLLDWISESY